MIEDDVPIDARYLADGEWTVDVAGREVAAIASLRPLYDPDMKRIRV
jgi:4-methylaminobutanoate oxidase (formaldehyde-forming)